MGLFDRLFGNESAGITWEEIKETDKVYPPNSISLFMLKTESGNSATAWVGKGYDKYTYKKLAGQNWVAVRN